jgi:thiol-disulfide isomerase/thioredoxin
MAAGQRFAMKTSLPIKITLFAVITGFLAWQFSRSLWGNSGPVTTASKRRNFPSLVLPALSGATWKLSDQRGKVTLVNVWASWCPPCRQETPGFVHLSKSLSPQQFAIVGISMDENKGDIISFVRRYRISYPILIPDASFAAIENTIAGLPTSFLLDQDGRLAKAYVGAVQEEKLRSDIEQLLAEEKQTPTTVSAALMAGT